MNTILIIFLVLAAVSLGTWYAIRTIRLVRQDEKELPPIFEADTKVGMPTFNQVSPDVVKAFQNLSVSIKVDAAPALAAVGKAMAEATKAFGDIGKMYERVLDTKTWHFTKPYFDSRDMWVGVFWNYTDDIDVFDIDADELAVYICIIPCLVFKTIRTRTYKVVPRKIIDPVCMSCGLPHSLHPTSDAMQDEWQVTDGQTERIPEKWCEGNFIL